MLLTVIIAGLGAKLLMFFVNLSGAPWIYFFIASFTLMLLGAALITFAKFPIYRSGRFFTFGIKSVPEHLIKHYTMGLAIVFIRHDFVFLFVLIK